MKLLSPITSTVELVRLSRAGGELGLRIVGSTFDRTDALETAERLVEDIFRGLDSPTGVECLLVVENGAVVARFDLAAVQALADVLHLLFPLDDENASTLARARELGLGGAEASL